MPGEGLGGELWGGTLYLFSPGEETPYHWHYGEEEILVVLAGRLTLRTTDGERQLEPWDAAWVLTGEGGAHGLRNDGEEPARFVMFSTLSDPEVTVYPDTGKVAAFAGWSRDGVREVRGFVEPA